MDQRAYSFSEYPVEPGASTRPLNEPRTSFREEEGPAVEWRPPSAARRDTDNDGVLDSRWARQLAAELRATLGLSPATPVEVACAALETHALGVARVRRVLFVACSFLVRASGQTALAVVPANLTPEVQAEEVFGLLGEALFVPPPPTRLLGETRAEVRSHREALQRHHRRSSAFGRVFASAFLGREEQALARQAAVGSRQAAGGSEGPKRGVGLA